MSKKKIGILFLIAIIVVISGVVAFNMAVSMSRRGVLPKEIASTIVALSVPVIRFATVVALSLLIYLIFKK